MTVSKLADSIPTEFVYVGGSSDSYTGIVVERNADSVLVELNDDYGSRAAQGLKPEYRRLKLAKILNYVVLN